MVDKKHLVVLFIFHFPASGQRLLVVGEHVEEFDKFFVVLILFVVDRRVGSYLVEDRKEVVVLFYECASLGSLLD